MLKLIENVAERILVIHDLDQLKETLAGGNH